MSTNLNPHGDAAKYAIDLRLDTIDRALLGLLPRHARIELVAQIETKIRESAANLPVDDVLNEIAQDRAVRQEDAMDSAVAQPATYSHQRRFSPRRRPRSRLALSSGILGIVALALLIALPFMYLIVSMLNGDEWLTVSLLGGHVGAVLLGGLLAVALGIAALVVLNRHGGRLVGHGWAITGLCTGPLPMFAGGLVALVVGSQLWGNISVTPAYSTSPTVPPSGPIAANPYGDPNLAPPGAVPSTSLPVLGSNADGIGYSNAPPSYPVPAGLPPTAESPAVAPTYAQQAASNEPPPAPDAPSAAPNTSAPTPPSDVVSSGDHP